MERTTLMTYFDGKHARNSYNGGPRCDHSLEEVGLAGGCQKCDGSSLENKEKSMLQVILLTLIDSITLLKDSIKNVFN